MKRVAILLIGAIGYLMILQFGHDAAAGQTTSLQILYTSAGSEAAAISAAGP